MNDRRLVRAGSPGARRHRQDGGARDAMPPDAAAFSRKRAAAHQHGSG